MKWRVVDKTKSKVPSTGTYRTWKPQLADEARLQCVYCCIHESNFGGVRNFHVEHFKPKSLFPALENDYANLFYACGVCNVFKSDDWPAELDDNDFNSNGYPNPARVNYADFLVVDTSTGKVVSEFKTGKYVIERLHLNRPQMVGVRSLAAIMDRLQASMTRIRSMHESGSIPDHMKHSVIEVLFRTNDFLTKRSGARPYGSDQLK
ncbi:HNH endonuclease [Herbaspirillum huttiense]|uniref:HNH endonuclease n=1 Tax=Herbaspirillum huttiense TaxID=863372 RepID=UPI0038273A02